MMFRILEHTADVGIIAKGKTFEDALQEGARGMFSFMGRSKPRERMEISVERERKDELVVFLFSEILARCEADGFVPCRMNVLSYDGRTVKVEILGEYKTLKNIIKAVTFHMLEAKQFEGGWKIQVLFDI